MKDLFRIGDVSKLCNISIKTLRFYEEKKLIKPVKVDIYTGYRYYDTQNIQTIYKIKSLKELGFTLDEIRKFNETSLDEKFDQIKNQIAKLKDNLKTISYLQKQKGGEIMKPFINDENAIGKWIYECSTISKECYDKNDTYVDNDALIQELYFLPNGKGYWIFEKWTKNELYHFSGVKYPYYIIGDKLFVEVYNNDNVYQLTLVFTKSNSKEYSKDEIAHKDNVDIPFVLDDKSVGFWKACEYISYKNKNNYSPSEENKELFVTALSLMSNGEALLEFNNENINKILWTKDSILNQLNLTNSNFIIKTINNEDYLIMDWKSGDYIYGGKVFGCYVFKRIK